MRSEYDYGSKR
jgi:hypothetical protein